MRQRVTLDSIIWLYVVQMLVLRLNPLNKFLQHFFIVLFCSSSCSSSHHLVAIVKGQNVTEYDVELSLALLDALNVDNAAVISFASGGHAALRLAAEHPDRVNKLVTINTSPQFTGGSL